MSVTTFILQSYDRSSVKTHTTKKTKIEGAAENCQGGSWPQSSVSGSHLGDSLRVLDPLKSTFWQEMRCRK